MRPNCAPCSRTQVLRLTRPGFEPTFCKMQNLSPQPLTTRPQHPTRIAWVMIVIKSKPIWILPWFFSYSLVVDINECDSTPCQNGATCLNNANMYRCICPNGWFGTNCQEGKFIYVSFLTHSTEFHTNSFLYKSVKNSPFSIIMKTNDITTKIHKVYRDSEP